MTVNVISRTEITPGIVVNLSNSQWRYPDNGATYRFALYVVAIVDGIVSGPVIDGNYNVNEWLSVPLDTLPESPYTYPLGEVGAWPANVASFLARSGQASTTDQDELVRRAKAEQRAADVAEFEAWKESATETAHAYANENSLCSEFDRCMSDIGLRPREHEIAVDVEVTRSVTVYVNAIDAEQAAERAEEEALEAIQGQYGSLESFLRYATFSAE